MFCVLPAFYLAIVIASLKYSLNYEKGLHGESIYMPHYALE